jgi:uncharacterized protein YkwD
LKYSPTLIFTFIILVSVNAFAQASDRPVAILVDQIGGAPLRLRAENRGDTRSEGVTIVVAAERRAFELMNAERQVAGLPMLVWSDEAAALARLHAKDMATNAFFSHKGNDGETVDGRAARMGVKWHAIGENIATMKGYADPAAKAVETWMNSSAHKRNILNGMYNQSAMGAALAADGTVYFTQVFLSK